MNTAGVYAVSVANPTINDIWISAKNRIEVISKCVLDPKPTSNFESVKTDIYDEAIAPFETLQQMVQHILTKACC